MHELLLCHSLKATLGKRAVDICDGAVEQGD